MRFSLKNNFLFSVVIPTLNNRNKYLKEAINSIEKQSLVPSEVIIVNNGKGDLNIDKSFLNIQQFKIVFKGGVAQARNFGASLANGKYIAFLDDDDLWGQNYLKKMKESIESNDPDCLIGRLDQYKNNKIMPYKNAHQMITKNIILVRNPGITGSSVIIKKDVFLKIGGYNVQLITGEDKSLILELIYKNFKINTVPESQAIIRKSEIQRLSNSENMYEGVLKFYNIYKHKMYFRHKIINLYKIYKHLWIFKKSIFSGLIYLFFYLCILPEKLIKKINKKN